MTIQEAYLVQLEPSAEKEVFSSLAVLAEALNVYSIEVVRIVGSSGVSDGKVLPTKPAKEAKPDKPIKSGKPRGRPKGSGKKAKPNGEDEPVTEPEPLSEPEPEIPEFEPAAPVESPLPDEEEELLIPDVGRT